MRAATGALDHSSPAPNNLAVADSVAANSGFAGTLGARVVRGYARRVGDGFLIVAGVTFADDRELAYGSSLRHAIVGLVVATNNLAVADGIAANRGVTSILGANLVLGYAWRIGDGLGVGRGGEGAGEDHESGKGYGDTHGFVCVEKTRN